MGNAGLIFEKSVAQVHLQSNELTLGFITFETIGKSASGV